MPRKPRLHYPGAVYHVMLRGNGGQEIFADDADRSRFLLLTQQGIERYGHRLHAYCLMSNHVHLALQVADVPLSQVMQNLSFRYTQHVNRRQNRCGHLFQGRYKSLLVDRESYLLELVRYIHLNPVRAGMVGGLDGHRWSSHGCYCGCVQTPWLTTDWVLGQFDGDEGQARRLYRRFVRDGLEEGHREEFHRGSYEGRVLGADRFVEEAVLRAYGNHVKPLSMQSVLDTICAGYGIALAELAAPGRQQPHAEARAAAAWLVRQSGRLQLKDLGDLLNRDLSGLSQAARRLEERARDDCVVRERLDNLMEHARNSVCQA